MTYEFTPGPWRVDGTTVKAIDHGDWFMVAAAGGCRHTEAGNIANAHLIAAAPTMLAALEMLEAVMTRLGFDTEDTDISGGDTVEAMAEAWPRIVGAILKARGT